jgi:hypothetical protein
MKLHTTIAIAALAAFGMAACDDSPTDPDDGDAPRVIILAAAAAPTPPAGSQVQCYQNSDGVTLSQNCPVIRWNDVTYWVFAYEDGRQSLNLVAYDEDDNVIFSSDQQGARHIFQITVSDSQETVTLFGSMGATINVPWSVLEQAQGD